MVTKGKRSHCKKVQTGGVTGMKPPMNWETDQPLFMLALSGFLILHS